MIVLLILLVAGVLVAPAPPAWACSCAQVDALKLADVAFVGRVVSIGTDADGGRRVELTVESVQKGTVGELRLRLSRRAPLPRLRQVRPDHVVQRKPGTSGLRGGTW
jgi:hypothetical protein